MKGVLGAVLAGGLSRRFGSDKALAIALGKPLIDHAIGSLAGITPDVVVCGREWPGHICLPDRPSPGLGPLSGIAAALHHAREHGAHWVLSLACDIPFIEPTLLYHLVECRTACFVAEHPVIGLWPSCAADRLLTFLMEPGSRSMRRWAEAIGAIPWSAGTEIVNINYGHDLHRWINQTR